MDGLAISSHYIHTAQAAGQHDAGTHPAAISQKRGRIIVFRRPTPPRHSPLLTARRARSSAPAHREYDTIRSFIPERGDDGNREIDRR